MTKNTAGPQPRSLRKRHRDKGDLLFYSILMALPVLQILVFYFGVNFQSICMAFQTYSKSTDTYTWNPSINLNKFLLDISEKGFWIMVKNSIMVYVFTSLAGTVLAVIFAYYIYRKRFLSNFFKLMLFLPSVLPGIMMAIMYENFAGAGITGMLNFLASKEIVILKESAENAFFSTGEGLRLNLITLFTVWIGFGPQVLVYTGAMDRVDPSMLEAGRIDGANSVQEFFKIILPNISATVGTFLTIGVASIFTNQNNLFSFLADTADATEQNIGYKLYNLVNMDTGRSGYCYAAFLGLVCTLVVIPVAFGVRKLCDRGDNG